MRASEKLKALEEMGASGTVFVLLPQIVAVVEAAERIAGGATHWDEANGQMDAIRHSVAALEEALGGDVT